VEPQNFAVQPAVDPRFGSVATLFFGIGAQKAGTTWLHRYMRSHPDVATPALKETTYWNFVESGEPHPWTQARAARFGAGRGVLSWLLRTVGSPFPTLRPAEMMLQARMLSAPCAAHGSYADLLFHDHDGQPVAGEVSPNYALLSTKTFAEMNALSAQVRFIYILRDPVARAVSGLRMAVDRGWMRQRGIHSLDEAIRDALDEPDASYAIRSSRYDSAIARLEAAVPQERILYLFYEALFDQRTIDALTEFLGVRPHPAPTDKRILRGRRNGDRPTAEQTAALRAALAPTYAYIEARFGRAAVPGWLLKP
jgi:hypothetical protein